MQLPLKMEGYKSILHDLEDKKSSYIYRAYRTYWGTASAQAWLDTPGVGGLMCISVQRALMNYSWGVNIHPVAHKAGILHETH